MRKGIDTRWITTPIMSILAYKMGVDGWTIALVMVWAFPIKFFWNSRG